MDARGIANQVTVYPGVGHAFVHADNITVPGAAQDAWRELLDFLAAALKKGQISGLRKSSRSPSSTGQNDEETGKGEDSMRYKLLGRSGLRVSELALGTMTFGPEWGWGASKEESRRIFDAYVAAGGNFIDTANRYTEGTSERYVGEFIAADRERFVVATKYTLFNRRR